MGVSKNNGTPKSSILIGFSIINHPFRGTPLFGNSHIETFKKLQNMGPMVAAFFRGWSDSAPALQQMGVSDVNRCICGTCE